VLGLWLTVFVLYALGVAAWAEYLVAREADARDAEVADRIRAGFRDDVRFDERCPAVWHVGKGAWLVFSMPVRSVAFLLLPSGEVEPVPPRGLARRVHIAEAIGVSPRDLDDEGRLRPPRLVHRFFIPIVFGAWALSSLILFAQPGEATPLATIIAVVAIPAACGAALVWMRHHERSSDAAPRLPADWQPNSAVYA
jgi:hypothetical protein